MADVIECRHNAMRYGRPFATKAKKVIAHEESRRPVKKELSEEQPSTGHVSRNAPTDLGKSPIGAATDTEASA
jgi:hypothetical protein